MILRVLAAALLVAAAVSAWLLLGRGRTSSAPSVQPIHATATPGYVAQTARLTETGPDGTTIYTVDASTISEAPGSPVVSLDEVRMSFRDQSGHDWAASADHGSILSNASIIDLDGDVAIRGPLSGPQPAALITTDHLAVDTRTEVATTKSVVVLDWSGQKLRGRGLVARLKTEELTLESDVHGLFTPQQ
jgi:LPS export ABC transporter protein LptC